jgi:ATP-dependent helicase HepA
MATPSYVVGQRYVSEPEPELGLGVVVAADRFRVTLEFPAAEETRIYAAGAAVLKRVVWREGDRVARRGGPTFTIETVEDVDGLLHYRGEGETAREDVLTDAASFSRPQDRLLAARVDDNETFDLRWRALEQLHALRSSPLRGFMGGRVDLIPHQFYLLHEVAGRQLPRVLLSDEVGLGKTIEACLILQRLRAVGRADRVLILVPEALVHQWFVELLRRFNLWFSLLDEDRCGALEKSNEGQNPFLAEQLVLTSTRFLAESEIRAEQAIEAGWDLVIVDEAHHLEWHPEAASPAYAVVEQLATKTPGLLLLTATPTQLGLDGHFARLRLLDSDRYADFEAFQKENEAFASVARIAGKIVDGAALTKTDRKALARIFSRDPENLQGRLDAFDAQEPGARESLLRILLDQHGTGRVVFRNTRAHVQGFPARVYCPAPIELPEEGDETLRKRLARELEAEASGDVSGIRYAFKEDPRLEWLVDFLKAHREEKVLLICQSRTKAMALEIALKEAINLNVGLFHEALTLIQRDRNAAWFAEPEGAQLLICSEIGSEGRNFQFAHHLVLFDLPLNPGLLEQRIGRLDRIGQTATIRIHVPFLEGSPQELVARWYHDGLDAFRSHVHGGAEYQAQFGERLLTAALAHARSRPEQVAEDAALIAETAAFRAQLDRKLREGRDRLLELNSFHRPTAEALIESIREAERDSELRSFLFDLLDSFGVRMEGLEESGDVRIDPSHAFVDAIPGLPPEGALATFERTRAMAREDLLFVNADHPLVSECIGLLLSGEKGSSGFAVREADTPNLLVEALFVIETVAATHLHVDRFLAPRPLRIVVDLRGRNLSSKEDLAELGLDEREDGDIHRFLESPGFNRGILEALLDGAENLASIEADTIRAEASAEAERVLGEEIERLRSLQRLNPNVNPAEIAQAEAERAGVLAALGEARLRLDAVRLIVEGEIAAFRK